MRELDYYVKRFKKGDQTAFDILYDQTKTPVYYTIYSVLKDKSHTEDIMQETYMQMIKKIDSYTPKGQFLPWLKTIAHNKALNAYKHQSHETPIDTQDSVWKLTAAVPDEISRYRLENMLSILDEEEQLIVVRHVILNETFKTLSKHLNRPLGTVLWKYNQALKKMKRKDGDTDA